MKSKKGISLIPMIVFIIVMSILLGIVVNSSRDSLEKSKTEKLLVYMELVKARAKDYYEEVMFSQKIINEEIAQPEFIEKEENENSYFSWNAEMLKKQGIDNSYLEKEDEYFIVEYNSTENSIVDIYYSKGIVLNNETLYSLSKIGERLGKK